MVNPFPPQSTPQSGFEEAAQTFQNIHLPVKTVTSKAAYVGANQSFRSGAGGSPTGGISAHAGQ